MESLLAAIEMSALAQQLRFSRWLYATVNGAHIVAIAMLVGSTVPMSLRLLGVWGDIAVATIYRVLMPLAVAGLVLAISTGTLLFAVRATEYADIGVFRLKLALISIGAGSAMVAHWRHGLLLDRASPRRAAVHGTISLLAWFGALACGRLIAFVGD